MIQVFSKTYLEHFAHVVLSYLKKDSQNSLKRNIR
jgi:hypothetical protein